MPEPLPPEVTRYHPPPVPPEGAADAPADPLCTLEPPTQQLSAFDLPVTREWQPAAKPTGPEVDPGAATLDRPPRPDRRTDAPAPATLASPPPREASRFPQVAGYEILGELGRGGMGVVYWAWQTGLNRAVALKMLLAGAHAGPQTRARFKVEAEAAARLQHPNIVPIYEIGTHEGLPYFSLEYLEGSSLADQLNAGPLPVERAVALVEALARALQYAHQKGIVHRDLKPANILLNADGVPKITDFGLAKLVVGGDSSPTVTGSIMGTPNYMAPEQAEGRTRDIGPLADVYALGAILYHLLTGRPPFQGTTMLDTLEQVRSLEPVPPQQLQRKVPRDLETVCLKCLQKEPRKRYPSAGDFAEDLRRFLAGEPVRARPVGTWERGVKWARRRPALAALYGVSAATALGLLAMTGWHYTDLRARLDEAQTNWRNEAQLRHEEEERTRLAGVRAQVQGLLAGAREDIGKEDWKAANRRLLGALARIDAEPALDDLRPQARGLLDRSSRLETLRQEVRGKVDQFWKRYDDALFHGTLLTGVDLPANLKACQAAAREALGLFGVAEDGKGGPVFPDRYLSDADKKAVTAGCYDLLLVLAEAVAQPLPGESAAARREHAGRALALLERAQQLGLTTRAYHLRKSDYLARLGEPAQAAAEWCRAQLIAPASANDQFLIGDLSYRAEDLPAAMGHFRRALDADPKHFWAQYFLAVCYLKSERPREAVAYLTSCLGRRDDFPWVYLLRGYAYAQLGDFASAEADFKEVARRDPNEYGLYVNRGLSRLEQGKLAEAVADLRHATRLKPDQYPAYVNLAEAYRRQKDLDEALRQLDRAVELAPAVAGNHWRRALVREERGDLAEALRDLDEAVRLENPASRRLAEYECARARMLRRRHKDAEALAACDAALRSDPDSTAAHRLRADTLLALNRGPEALADFDQYLRRDQDDPAAYRQRGFERAKQGDQPGAIADYTRSLEIEPRSAGTRARRGWALLDSREATRQALRDFDEAIKLEPRNGELYAGRGYARVLLGEYREGVADAEEGLKLGPRDDELRQRVALTYNAACVFAQAAGQAADDDEALAGRYRERALELLRKTLDLVPAPARAAYARQAADDPAFAPVRKSAAFHRVVDEYTRPGE
jgi:serine/threonine protein kinase/tetratricopeptide (TPR) repeat protein